MVFENNVIFPHLNPGYLLCNILSVFFCPVMLKERLFHTVVFPIIKEATIKVCLYVGMDHLFIFMEKFIKLLGTGKLCILRSS